MASAFAESRALNAALFEKHSKRADIEARRASKREAAADLGRHWTCACGVRDCRICGAPARERVSGGTLGGRGAWRKALVE